MSLHVVAPGSCFGADLGLCHPGKPLEGHLGVPAGSRSCSHSCVGNLALNMTVRALRPGRDTLSFHLNSKMWCLGSAEMLVCRGRNEGSNLLCLMAEVADGCKIRISGWTGVTCEALRGGKSDSPARLDSGNAAGWHMQGFGLFWWRESKIHSSSSYIAACWPHFPFPIPLDPPPVRKALWVTTQHSKCVWAFSFFQQLKL